MEDSKTIIWKNSMTNVRDKEDKTGMVSAGQEETGYDGSTGR